MHCQLNQSRMRDQNEPPKKASTLPLGGHENPQDSDLNSTRPRVSVHEKTPLATDVRLPSRDSSRAPERHLVENPTKQGVTVPHCSNNKMPRVEEETRPHRPRFARNRKARCSIRNP